MAKKKPKTPVVNAVDKYLMQKKYTRAPREKFQSPSSTPKVAQSKNSSLNSTVKRTRSRSSKDDFSLPNVRTLRSLKPADEAKIDLKTESKKSSEGRKTNVRKTVPTKSTKPNKKDSIAPVAVKKSTSEKIQPKNQRKCTQSAKKPEAVPPAKMTTRKRKLEKESSTDFEKRQRVEFKIVKKPSIAVKNAQSSEPSRKAAKNIRKRKGEAILPKNNTKRKSKTAITAEQSKTAENVEVEPETVAKEKVPVKTNKVVRKKRTKDTAPPSKKPAQSDLTSSQSTSLKSHERRDNSTSSDESGNECENTSEINPLMKKYQPYMKRIRSLNSEEIAKFIKDNQQYYVDFKNGIESKDKRRPRKQKDEMKSLFKCNPFNSEQQIAMYVTLREVFNIPQTHFKECRHFFISLLPEISCQLFAEVFRIRATFAPRLIKRLYPKPVCPV